MKTQVGTHFSHLKELSFRISSFNEENALRPIFSQRFLQRFLQGSYTVPTRFLRFLQMSYVFESFQV